MLATYWYDAYGNFFSATGAPISAPTETTHLFAMLVFDPASKLHYALARFLDTGSGRFVSQDPYEGSLQSPLTLPRYWYAGGDPKDNIDPTGKFFTLALWLANRAQRDVATASAGAAATSTLFSILQSANAYYAAFAIDVGVMSWLALTDSGEWFRGKYGRQGSWWSDASTRGPELINAYKNNHIASLMTTYPNTDIDTLFDVYAAIYPNVVNRECALAMDCFIPAMKAAITDTPSIKNSVRFEPAVLKVPSGEQPDNILVVVPRNYTGSLSDLMTNNPGLMFFYVGSEPLAPVGNLHAAVSNSDKEVWGTILGIDWLDDGF